MSGTIRILYVDDEPELLNLGTLFLKRLGDFLITTSESALKAIEILQIETFDAIISDYQMPQMDGIAFLIHLRSTKDKTPFILYTGKGREEVAIDALNNGADFYLQKGGDPKSQFAELANQVKSAVSRRQAEKNLLESQKKIADIIDFLPDATFAINLDGEVIAWNRATEIMTGTSKDSVLGQSDYAHSIPFYGTPRDMLLDLIDKRDEEFPPEYQAIQRNGSTIYAEVYHPVLFGGKGAYIWATATPLFDTEGNRVGAIESLRDITMQKNAESLLQKRNYELLSAYEQISATEEELRSNLNELSTHEQLLRISEKRLIMAQEISKTGCWEYNIEHNTIWGSAEGLRIFGFPPVAGDFPIDDIEACIEERERVHQALINLLTTGSEYNQVYLIHPADGSEEKWIHSVARIEIDNYGNHVRVIGIIQDITEQKIVEINLQKKNWELLSAYEQISATQEELRANLDSITHQEEIIRESEEKFQSLYMNMIEGSALHELVFDKQGNVSDYIIIQTNNAFEKQLGISWDTIVGKTSREAYGTLEPPYLEIYSRVALTQKPEIFETYFQPLDKHFSISVYSPYPNSFVTIFEDITQRVRYADEREKLIIKLEVNNVQLNAAYEEITATEEELRHQYNALASAEEKLHETKEFLENLLSVANVPIIVWDQQYRIMQINRACELLIGRTAEELIGEPLITLFPPDQANRSMRLLETTLEGVRWETVEIEILHHDGSHKTILWNSATLYNQDGITPVATIAQGRDISHERKLEKDRDDALLQIQKNLAQLSILNDEIRNPLTIIVTYVEMTDNPGLIDQIAVQTQRIDMMVNQLDRRWLESEKVLNAIRKHYHIHSVHSPTPQDYEEPEIPEEYTKILPIQAGIQIQSDTSGILMQEVQAQLYTILDSIDALVYVADMQTYEILFINRQGRAHFGNITGQKCYTWLQPDQKGPCEFCTNKYLLDKTGPLGVYQWEWHHPLNGKWYDCRDRAIRWSDGRFVRLEIATDITEQKRTTEELRKREKEHQWLLNSMINAFALFESVFDGDENFVSYRFSYINQAYEQITGVKSTEVYGKTIHEVWPDTEPEWILRYGQVAITGISQTFDLYHDPTKKIYHCHVYRPFETTDRFCVIFEDITEQKKSEEQLRESESRVQRKLHALLDPKGDISSLNLADILNIEKIQLLMEDFHSITGILVAILDIDGKVLVSAGWQDICTKFHRVHPQTAQNCLESDTELSAGVKRGYSKLYKCKNNMWDVSTPIIIGNAHVGNFFLGQFFFDDEEPDIELFRRQAQQYGFDEEAYITALQKVPKLKKETVDTIMQYYNRLIDLITQISWSNIKLARIISERDELVDSVRKNQEKYQQLIEYANESIIVVQDECIKLLNPMTLTLTGYEKHELLDKPFSIFIHPDERDGIVDRYQRRIQGEELPSRYSFRILRKDGAIAWCDISAVVIEWEGRPATLNFIVDNTDRKIVEETLLESNKKNPPFHQFNQA
jgi:PAS domain S-box-containing protein